MFGQELGLQLEDMQDAVCVEVRRTVPAGNTGSAGAAREGEDTLVLPILVLGVACSKMKLFKEQNDWKHCRVQQRGWCEIYTPRMNAGVNV